MRVNLDYFRPTGKWYASGHYDTTLEDLGDIWDEVRALAANRMLPGLCANHSDYVVSINVPDHPHNHPRLIMPDRGGGWNA